MSSINVGFARVEINPKLGNGIAGYFKPRLTEGYLDPLEINLLAIGKNGANVILAALDTTSFKNDTADLLRRRVAEATGLPVDAIFIAATHTHTAPYLGEADQGAPEDLTAAYTAEVADKLTRAACDALRDQKPAKMGLAITKVPGIAFVRRYRMKDGSVRTNPGVFNPDAVEPIGQVDERAGVLRFDREDGETFVLLNFACHPDTIGGNLISADWPGFFRRTFEKAVEHTRCIYFNGMEGDINHVKVHPTGGDMNDLTIDFDDVPRGYGHARHMGRCVAGAVLQVFDKVEYLDVDRVTFARKTIQLPTNMPRPEELPEAHRINALHEAGRDNEIPYEGMMLTTVVAEAGRMCRLEHGPKTIPMDLYAIALGGVVLLGAPGEPFNPIGVALKEAPGWKSVFPCCLTNGEIGYFPMRDSYEEGGYESRSSVFRAGVAELIIEEGLKMLEELR